MEKQQKRKISDKEVEMNKYKTTTYSHNRQREREREREKDIKLRDGGQDGREEAMVQWAVAKLSFFNRTLNS